MTIKMVILFAVLLQANQAFAATYFIAANGNDKNNGTSISSPFKTIARLNKLMLQPGDRIYFRRGDVFRGELKIKQSGNAATPIILDAYGNGALPVISGTETVKNWVLQSGNIYKASFSSNPVMVFMNKQLHLPARFPNTGFLSIDEGQGKKQFYDAALTQANTYWNGATLHNRMVRWDYGEHTVQSFNNGNITIAANAEYDFSDGWGYFFTNKYELLDTAGEFFYNKTLNQLFIWSTTTPQYVEASFYDYGVVLRGISYVSIQNLSFTGQVISGINSGTDNTNIKVMNCHFSNIFNKAVEMYNVNNVLLADNVITDILNKGIVLYDCRNLKVERNRIRRIGLMPGIASKNEIAYTAMEVEGNIKKGSVRFNVLDSIGYNGLRFSKNTVIEKNNISNFCLTTDDGSAIYTWSNNDTIIRNGTGCRINNNIIQNGLGNTLATTDLFGFANGIYMDDASGNAWIRNNTVVNCKAIGIFLHNSINNLVENNTVFNCAQTQMLLGQDGLSNTPVSGNIVRDNILYSINEDTYPLQVTNTEDSGLAFAAWSGNYYNNPYNSFGVYTQRLLPNGSVSKLYTVNDWRANADSSANQSNVQWNAFRVTDTIGGNQIVNGNFTNNSEGWYCWSPDDNCNSTWGVNNQLNRGSLRLRSNDGIAYNLNYFALNAGQSYQLSFSNIAASAGDAIAVQTMNANTYAGLEFYKFVPAGIVRSDHNFIFKPTFTTNPARINFYVNNSAPDYWLDNIKLYKVNAEYDNPQMRNLIFINETNANKIISLQQTLYDIDNNPVSGSITLAPYTSKILLKKEPIVANNVATRSLTESFFGIHLFPNPTNDFVNIRLKQAAKFIRITDMAGRLLQQIDVGSNLYVKINLTQYKTGIYLVSVFNENDMLLSREKLIKN